LYSSISDQIPRAALSLTRRFTLEAGANACAIEREFGFWISFMGTTPDLPAEWRAEHLRRPVISFETLAQSPPIADQKTRLTGISFQGPYECWYSCYDIVSDMLDKGTPSCPQPHRFGARSSEVAREKPPKELVIGSGSHVAVSDAKQQVKCNIKNELEMAQAFTRRALAFDLMSACTFSVMEKFHQFLLGYLQMLPPGVFPSHHGAVHEG